MVSVHVLAYPGGHLRMRAYIEEPGPGGLQPVHHNAGEPLAELVAEGRIVVAGRAQGAGVDSNACMGCVVMAPKCH